MSGRLISDVLADLPAGATLADSAVAVMIAYHANETTRICYPGMDLLAAETRMRPKGVQRCLTHLASLGYDLRHTSAHRGTRSTYRVPDRKTQPSVAPSDDGKGVASVPPFSDRKGVVSVPPFSPERWTSGDRKVVPKRPERGYRNDPPSFHEPSDKQPRGDAAASPWMNDFLNGINQPRGRLPRIKPVGRIPELCGRIETAGWTPQRAAKYIASESGIDIAKADTRTGLIVDKITEAAGIAEADQIERAREQRRRDFAINYAAELPDEDVDPQAVAEAKALIADTLTAQRDARAAAKAEREQARLARQAAEQAERERVAAAFAETGIDVTAAGAPVLLPDPDGDPAFITLPPSELQRALDRPPLTAVNGEDDDDADEQDGAA